MTAPVARMKHKNVIRSRSITYLLTYKPRTGTPAAKLQRLHCQTSLTITGGYPGEILYKAAQEIVDQYLISKWSKIELQISLIISEAVYIYIYTLLKYLRRAIAHVIVQYTR